MKRETLAKRSGLAAALNRGRSEDTPEAEAPTQEAPARPKAKAPARFHTSFYPSSRQLYDDVKIALIREGKSRDFNQLVNELLTEWLDATGSDNA